MPCNNATTIQRYSATSTHREVLEGCEGHPARQAGSEGVLPRLDGLKAVAALRVGHRLLHAAHAHRRARHPRARAVHHSAAHVPKGNRAQGVTRGSPGGHQGVTLTGHPPADFPRRE
eukprot:2138709-Pyramimonas_sp.AAC.2